MKKEQEQPIIEAQFALQNVIGSFNALIATVIGGTIGLSIGIVGIFILNCR